MNQLSKAWVCALVLLALACAKATPPHVTPYLLPAPLLDLPTDVLEHLEADEVTPALKELTRVAGKMLVLKIASRGDAVHSLQASKLAAHLQAAAAAGGGVVGGDDVAVPAGSVAAGAAVALPRNLHPTVHRPEWWAAQIVQLGFRQHSRIPHPPRRPWMCCTTVFVRDSSRDSG